MHAVGVEGGEGHLRRLVAAQVEPDLAALVAHDQLAAREGRRQRHHERREHAGRLLGVAVADEEAALVVDQQLVELGRDRLVDAQSLGGAGDDRLERPCPVPAADAYRSGPICPQRRTAGSTMVSAPRP